MVDNASGPKPVPAASAVPDRLHDCDQWVCWREEQRDGEDKPTKTPIDPTTGSYASTTDPDTWNDIETCRAYATDETTDAAGVGFVFTDDDPFVGVDLDDCRIPATGTLAEDAQEIVDRLDSYTEVSPSGTGVHVLLEGELPDGRNRRGEVELYDDARYFTVTGEHLEDTPTSIEARQDALDAVHSKFVGEDEEDTADGDGSDETASTATDDTASGANPAVPGHDLSDEELLDRARNAANGEKFARLWRGDTSGYPSQSEADMALCSLLAFWTDRDAARVDRLFRQSGLMREKWDEQHYADGTTYGEKTVERAVQGTDEGFTPGGNSAEFEDDADGSPPAVTSMAEKRDTGTDDGTGPDATAVTNEDDDLTAASRGSLVTAIRDLQAENERLRDELEQVRAERDELADRLTDEDTDDEDDDGGLSFSFFSRSED